MLFIKSQQGVLDLSEVLDKPLDIIRCIYTKNSAELKFFFPNIMMESFHKTSDICLKIHQWHHEYNILGSETIKS